MTTEEEHLVTIVAGGPDRQLFEILWAHASARRAGEDSNAHRHRGVLLAMLSRTDQRAAQLQVQLREVAEARAVEVRALRRALRDDTVSVWLRDGVLAIGSRGGSPCSEPYVAPDGQLYSHAGSVRPRCPCGWRFVAVFSDWAHASVHTCSLPDLPPLQSLTARADDEPLSVWARVVRALRRWRQA